MVGFLSVSFDATTLALAASLARASLNRGSWATPRRIASSSDSESVVWAVAIAGVIARIRSGRLVSSRRISSLPWSAPNWRGRRGSRRAGRARNREPLDEDVLERRHNRAYACAG